MDKRFFNHFQTGEIVLAKTINMSYQVVQLPEPIRKAIRNAREASGQTNLDFVAEAVTRHLASLLPNLRSLGFGSISGERRPARLPFSPAAGPRQVLREASNQVQAPAMQLLLFVPGGGDFRSESQAQDAGQTDGCAATGCRGRLAGATPIADRASLLRAYPTRRPAACRKTTSTR
jgi:hypothetical protein